MTESFPDFVEAVRNGRVMAPDLMSERVVTVRPLKLDPADWAIPSFDFGFALDPDHRDFVGMSVVDGAFAFAHNFSIEDKFRLPFEQCAYVLRYSETNTRYDTVNVIHLVADGDGVVGTTYFQQDINDPVKRRWTRTPFQFFLCSEGVEISFDPDCSISGAVKDEQHEDAKTKYTEVMVATMLLSLKATAQRQDAHNRLPDYNKARLSAGLKPLAPTVRVKLDRVSLFGEVAALVASPFGSKRAPHFRRGHYRKLRSGRTVEVAPSAIHGGAPTTARSYLVH